MAGRARPKEQHAFGSTQVQFDPAQVSNGITTGPNGQYGAAKTVSAADLVRILKEIQSASKQSGLHPKLAKHKSGFEDLYRQLFKEFNEFARELPVMFRWTVFTQEISEAAFEHYLKHHHKPMWKNRKEMLAAQAEYLVKKFQIDCPREANSGRVAQYRKNIVKMLEKEDEQYETASKEAQRLAKEGEELQLKLARQRLLDSALVYQREHASDSHAPMGDTSPADVKPATEASLGGPTTGTSSAEGTGGTAESGKAD